jgi:hypothetical protein
VVILKAFKLVFCLVMVQPLGFASLRAQEEPPAKPDERASAPAAQTPTRKEAPLHRFWDSTNVALFAGVAGARALDYASTRNMRSRGVNEALLSNNVVDNRPLFVGIEAAGAALSLGASYLFHRSGHHKLERWVSIVHIGVGVGGSIRNFGLQPQPALPAGR